MINNIEGAIPLPEPESESWNYLMCPHGCNLHLRAASPRDEYTARVEVRWCSSHPDKFNLQADRPTDLSCPGCDKHIRMKLVEGPDGTGSSFEDDEGQDDKHAFMACLWAPNGDCREAVLKKLRKHVHDAFVLGFALAKHCIEKRRILLVTKGAREFHEVKFLDQFWELRTMEHLPVHPSRVGGCDLRFQGVFNKIRAWEQIDFDKVVLLDLDIMVVRSTSDSACG